MAAVEDEAQKRHRPIPGADLWLTATLGERAGAFDTLFDLAFSAYGNPVGWYAVAAAHDAVAF